MGLRVAVVHHDGTKTPSHNMTCLGQTYKVQHDGGVGMARRHTEQWAATRMAQWQREREGGIHGKKNNIRLEGEKVEWFSLISGPRGKTIISVG